MELITAVVPDDFVLYDMSDSHLSFYALPTAGRP